LGLPAGDYDHLPFIKTQGKEGNQWGADKVPTSSLGALEKMMPARQTIEGGLIFLGGCL